VMLMSNATPPLRRRAAGRSTPFRSIGSLGRSLMLTPD
jgi:hypothetical protein